MNPLTYKNGLLRKGGELCFSLVMHGFCSNKDLYSASLSFTMFVYWASGSSSTGPTKQGHSIHPSIRGVFLELDHAFFPKFGMVLETQMKLCSTEPGFFRKTFAPNTGKMGQNGAKSRVF